MLVVPVFFVIGLIGFFPFFLLPGFFPGRQMVSVFKEQFHSPTFVPARVEERCGDLVLGFAGHVHYLLDFLPLMRIVCVAVDHLGNHQLFRGRLHLVVASVHTFLFLTDMVTGRVWSVLDGLLCFMVIVDYFFVFSLAIASFCRVCVLKVARVFFVSLFGWAICRISRGWTSSCCLCFATSVTTFSFGHGEVNQDRSKRGKVEFLLKTHELLQNR